MRIKSITGLLVAAALAVSAISMVPAPAIAVGDGNPVIVAPATLTDPERPGPEVPVGWSGPVIIDLSNSPIGSHTVDVRPNGPLSNTYRDVREIRYDGSQDVFTFDITPITVAGEYYVHVVNTDVVTGDDSYDHADLSFFTVVPDPVTPPEVIPPAVTSVSPGTFYPHVSDGYHDTANVTFTGSGHVVRVEVRNASGTLVRSDNLGELAAGSHSWEWDGRRNDGALAPVGDYKVKVAARTGEQTLTSGAALVRVATGYQWRRVSRSKNGDEASTSRSSGCTVDRGYWSDYGVFLECSGGRYASAKLAFTIPSSARNLNWSVRGEAFCCSSPGQIHKGAYRPWSTRYEVKVKVTGWRSYDVESATIWYDARIRV